MFQSALISGNGGGTDVFDWDNIKYADANNPFSGVTVGKKYLLITAEYNYNRDSSLYLTGATLDKELIKRLYEVNGIPEQLYAGIITATSTSVVAYVDRGRTYKVKALVPIK